MSWGVTSWGLTPWGGGNPLPGTGVVRLQPVNIDKGGIVQFPASPTTLDGKTVVSPLAFPEEGYYELVIEASPHTMVVPIVVADPTTLRVKFDTVDFDGKDDVYLSMTNQLALSYGRGDKALPYYVTEGYKAVVQVNKAINLTIKVMDGENVHDMGYLLAPIEGRYLSSEFLLLRGRAKLQAAVAMAANPYVITQKQITSITNPIGIEASSSLVAPIGSTPGTASLPISNDTIYDLNSYSATGVANFAANFQAVDAAAHAASPAQFITMTGVQNAATFRMSAVSDPRVITSLSHVLDVRNNGTTQNAIIAPIIKDAATDQVIAGRDWQIPPNNTWYGVDHTWQFNPFTGLPWQPGDVNSQRYRFGMRRSVTGDIIMCQRIYVLPVY